MLELLYTGEKIPTGYHVKMLILCIQVQFSLANLSLMTNV